MGLIHHLIVGHFGEFFSRGGIFFFFFCAVGKGGLLLACRVEFFLFAAQGKMAKTGNRRTQTD